MIKKWNTSPSHGAFSASPNHAIHHFSQRVVSLTAASPSAPRARDTPTQHKVGSHFSFAFKAKYFYLLSMQMVVSIYLLVRISYFIRNIENIVSLIFLFANIGNIISHNVGRIIFFWNVRILNTVVLIIHTFDVDYASFFDNISTVR